MRPVGSREETGSLPPKHSLTFDCHKRSHNLGWALEWAIYRSGKKGKYKDKYTQTQTKTNTKCFKTNLWCSRPCKPYVSMVTSPFISTVWCSRPYKPYIFWKLIIWWWQWPRQRLTKRQIQRQRHTYRQRQIQSAFKTQCMLYFSEAGGSSI